MKVLNKPLISMVPRSANTLTQDHLQLVGTNRISQDGITWFKVTGLEGLTPFSVTYLHEKKQYVAIAGMTSKYVDV